MTEPANGADAVYDEYLAAVREGDRRQAMAVIERGLAGGLELRELYLEVLQPALREIGLLWQQNQLSVAQEHLATAITQSVMLRVYSGLDPRPGSGPTLLAACAETERHEIGLRMLCDFLDLEGWTTVFLGASVPTEGLVQMVRDRKPDVVALSAAIVPHLPQLRATISAIRAAAPGDQRPLILVGGRPFVTEPGLAEAVGADLSARDAGQAVTLLQERFG